MKGTGKWLLAVVTGAWKNKPEEFTGYSTLSKFAPIVDKDRPALRARLDKVKEELAKLKTKEDEFKKEKGLLEALLDGKGLSAAA